MNLAKKKKQCFLVTQSCKHHEERYMHWRCGVTNLERLCVGLPSAVIARDNQLDSCQSLNNDGFIYFLGEAKDINSNDIYDNICKIFNSTDDLKNKSLKGKSLVDGNGIKE